MITWTDVTKRVTGDEAKKLLSASNDKKYWDKTKGIFKVDPGRWRDAQKQELEYWFANSESVPCQYYDYKMINRSIPANLGKTIEIGCGPCPQLTHFTKKMEHVTLLDPLLENLVQLPICEYRSGRFGDYVPELICDSAETVMICEEYDTVLCIACLEHVSNAEMVLDNLIKIVKPGGIIVVMERVFDGMVGTKHLTPDIYYDKRRPIKLYKQTLLDWAKQLTVIKQSWLPSVHQFDIQLKNVESLVGIYKKPKYSR